MVDPGRVGAHWDSNGMGAHGVSNGRVPMVGPSRVGAHRNHNTMCSHQESQGDGCQWERGCSSMGTPRRGSWGAGHHGGAAGHTDLQLAGEAGAEAAQVAVDAGSEVGICTGCVPTWHCPHHACHRR